MYAPPMSFEASPARKQRLREKSWREADAWRKRNGPVEVRFDPSIIRPKRSAPPKPPR